MASTSKSPSQPPSCDPRGPGVYTDRAAVPGFGDDGSAAIGPRLPWDAMSRGRAPWEIAYRERIERGEEACRVCGRRRPANVNVAMLRRDGLRSPGNCTILCSRDVQARQRDPQPPRLPSLADEERAAPPERRWSELAKMGASAAKGTTVVRCALCEKLRELDEHGRFVDHLAKGVPGTATRLPAEQAQDDPAVRSGD